MPYKNEVAILICIYTHHKRSSSLWVPLSNQHHTSPYNIGKKKTNPNYIPEIKKIVEP